MSIKVYNGFMFEDADAAVIARRLAEWRGTLRPTTLAAVATYLANEAAHVIDQHFESGESVSATPLCLAWQKYNEDRANSDKGHRHPRTDFGFAVDINLFEGRYYGLVFTEQSAWIEQLCEAVPMRPYAYWDDTDRDEAVPESDWQERRRVWLGVIKHNYGQPRRVDLTVDCTSYFALPSDQEVVGHLPDFPARLAYQANRLALQHYMTGIAQVTTDTQPQQGFRAAIEAFDWLQQPPGREFVETEKLRLAAVMPQQLSLDMLCGRFDFAPASALMP